MGRDDLSPMPWQADDGYLYPLERAFFYVFKPPMLLLHEDIDTVEFARQDGAMAASTKTFDLVIRYRAGAVRAPSACAINPHIRVVRRCARAPVARAQNPHISLNRRWEIYSRALRPVPHDLCHPGCAVLSITSHRSCCRSAYGQALCGMFSNCNHRRHEPMAFISVSPMGCVTHR